MPLCPGCNKFPAYDMSSEPEVEVEVQIECLDDKAMEKQYRGHITGSVRIVLTSECCSEEIKESTFDIDIEDVDVAKAKDCECEDWTENADVEGEGGEISDRSETHSTRIAKRGPDKGKEVRTPIPYRYQKRYYGASVPLVINCACGKQIGEAHFEDECRAGAMDELV